MNTTTATATATATNSIRGRNLTQKHVGYHIDYSPIGTDEIVIGTITRVENVQLRNTLTGEPDTATIITINRQRHFLFPVQLAAITPQKTASKTGCLITTTAALTTAALAAHYGWNATNLPQTILAITGILCAAALITRVIHTAQHATHWTN